MYKRQVKSCALPVVVKADGLALGKGVLIAETREDAVDVYKRQGQYIDPMTLSQLFFA